VKHFIGIKEVDAKPMTRGEYNKYRGWQIPADENPDDEGYLVKHSDSYESWSPKEVFDEAYIEYDGTGLLSTIDGMRSPDYRERFKAEVRQLEIRTESLFAIIKKHEKGKLEFELKCPFEILEAQFMLMRNTLALLRSRAKMEGIALHTVADAQDASSD
jgi:hypothetical protein